MKIHLVKYIGENDDWRFKEYNYQAMKAEFPDYKELRDIHKVGGINVSKAYVGDVRRFIKMAVLVKTDDFFATLK